ncbi:hypothetical protein DB30_03268 [Enhygromyxa salina]|uniref:Uncharacterized protein n=1 Tax=Enhygromyxa salina TaxID=215803 RepID=A0A0C2CPB6_9BACT|nr:hypothetical protein DB30_03268 [Enhygromyxa salina]
MVAPSAVAPPPVIVDPSAVAKRELEAPTPRPPKATIPILVNPNAGRFGKAGKSSEDDHHPHAPAPVDAPDLLPDE